MIVDVHAHYHPRAYHEALSRMPGWGGGGPFAAGRHVTDDPAQVAARLEMMDQAGVGVQVLSPAAGWAPYSEDEAASTAAARIGNDLTAALATRHPPPFT